MTQVALVTGATQGLGFSIASVLHGAGFAVVVTGRTQQRAEAAAREIDPSGERVQALKLDISSKAELEGALAAILERWGALHVVVNNATMTLTTPVMEISPEEFDQVTGINQRGTFMACQVFGSYLAQAGYGRIINMASLAGQNGGTATGAHYAASKAAITTLTKIFARELGPSGVTVNAIAPGPIESPMVSAVPAERMAQIVQNIPVRRIGNPEFIGKMVWLLAGEDAYFTTGATWDVNGGLFMR